MPLFGHKTGFRARMNEIKSGIPCSGCIPGNQHITSQHAAIFCNHLAKLSQKIVAFQKTNTSHGPTIFCNHLANLLQKIIASQKPINHMLLLSFVIILQSCYKRSQHPRKPTHHNDDHMLLLSQKRTKIARFRTYYFGNVYLHT